jgi:hypothetical protein
MIVSCFSMHGEHIIKYTNAKCHVFTVLYARGRYSFEVLDYLHLEDTNAKCQLCTL